MTIESVVNDLVTATNALHANVADHRTVLDAAAQAAAASLLIAQGKQAQAEASAATAATKAAEATSNADQIAAYRAAAAALDTTTTASAAVANLLPDMLAKKDPARHPFRKKFPTLVLDLARQKCHRYSAATGFAETALSSFMTFTRSTTAMVTGPDGRLRQAAINEPRYDYDPLTGECKGLLVEETRTNLLTYSAIPGTISPWSVAESTVVPYVATGPDGGLTAIKIIAKGNPFARIERGTDTATAGNPRTLTWFIKKDNTSYAHATVENVGIGATSRIYINLDTLGCTVTQGTFTSVTATAKLITDGWISLTITYIPTITSTYQLFIGPSSNAGTTSSIAGNSLFVWGAQLEVGSFPTSYIPTLSTFTGRASTATYLDSAGVVQTAGAGVARSAAYDYDANGVLRPIGLLLESAATNMIKYSAEFDNALWMKNLAGIASAPVVTANYGVAPDGTTTADRIVFALNGGTTIGDRSELAQSQTTVAGTTYTQSIWLKTVDGSTKTFQLSFSGENSKLITVTGTWQRFNNTGVASDTIRNFRLTLRGASGTSDFADVLIWGAQQGVGSYPTSYIPTTSAQVTRAADTSTSAQVTRAADDTNVGGSNFSGFYNQTQGTIIGEFNNTSNSNTLDTATYRRGTVCMDDGLASNQVRLAAAGVDIIVKSAGAMLFTDTIGTVTVNGKSIQALRLKKNDFKSARDGALGIDHLSGNIPNLSTMRIGKSDPGNGYLNAHISRVTYYPQPFTNEELQAFTAL